MTVEVTATSDASGVQRVRVALAIDAGWRVVGRRPSGAGLVGLTVSVPRDGLTASPVYPPAGDYTDSVVVDVPLVWRRGSAAAAVRVRVVFQACDARECRPPETVLLETAAAPAR